MEKIFFIKFWSLGICKKNTINSFEQLGLTDPTVEFRKNAYPATFKKLEEIDFNEFLYPADVMEDRNKQPQIIFLPDVEILQKIIKTVIRCKNQAEIAEKFSFGSPLIAANADKLVIKK